MTIPEVVITSFAINKPQIFWAGFLQCNMYDNTARAVTLRLRLRLPAKRRLP
jgi:hypothetical protein